MFEPDNSEIARELAIQSHDIYDIADLGGTVGPTMEEFNRKRPKGWPGSEYMLKIFGLTKNAAGWLVLLQTFGLLSPTPHEIQTTAQMRRDLKAPRASIPLRDEESYMPLTGSLVGEVTVETHLGNGWYRRTTSTIVSLR